MERLAADLAEYHLMGVGDNRRVVCSTMLRVGDVNNKNVNRKVYFARKWFFNKFFFELISEKSDHCGSNLGYLVSSFTGTEQTDGLWSCRDRREDTEATH